MSLIRTFHPVGQGAFYTERHSFRGNDFTIVYDCGSLTLKGKKLEKKIKSTFPKDSVIDILFISHFHSDHINGLEILARHCKIKKVVLPLINEDSKTLLKISNLIESDFTDTRLIDNPEEFFGEGVSVLRIESDDTKNDFENLIPIDISKIEGSIKYTNGTVFTLTIDMDWYFVPFNFEQNIRKTQFEQALSNYNLSLNDIDTIIKINKHKINIIKAYSEVEGDLNINSMILFSGKKSEDEIFNTVNFDHFCLRRHYRLQSGCLYTGDIDLNQPNLINEIETKLNYFKPFIGTIQIPHHGSVHNFKSEILFRNIQCAVISYGNTNTYGHPSDRVIGDIVSREICLRLVTELQSSIVTQWK